MNGKERKTSHIALALACLVTFVSSLGCNLIGIPSYRNADAVCTPACPTGPLPPLPKCLAEWQARKDLPAASEYPRFHPLPTRPMFAARGQDYPHE